MAVRATSAEVQHQIDDFDQVETIVGRYMVHRLPGIDEWAFAFDKRVLKLQAKLHMALLVIAPPFDL